jgi:hypothetical protein
MKGFVILELRTIQISEKQHNVISTPHPGLIDDLLPVL